MPHDQDTQHFCLDVREKGSVLTDTNRGPMVGPPRGSKEPTVEQLAAAAARRLEKRRESVAPATDSNQPAE